MKAKNKVVYVPPVLSVVIEVTFALPAFAAIVAALDFEVASASSITTSYLVFGCAAVIFG